MAPFNSNLFPYLLLFLMFYYILPAAWCVAVTKISRTTESVLWCSFIF